MLWQRIPIVKTQAHFLLRQTEHILLLGSDHLELLNLELQPLHRDNSWFQNLCDLHKQWNLISTVFLVEVQPRKRQCGLVLRGVHSGIRRASLEGCGTESDDSQGTTWWGRVGDGAESLWWSFRDMDQREMRKGRQPPRLCTYVAESQKEAKRKLGWGSVEK